MLAFSGFDSRAGDSYLFTASLLWWCMKSHIIGSHEGYDLLVDGQRQSFQDVKASAYESAVLLKFVAKRTQKIEILDRTTGERVEMLGDGRVA